MKKGQRIYATAKPDMWDEESYHDMYQYPNFAPILDPPVIKMLGNHAYGTSVDNAAVAKEAMFLPNNPVRGQKVIFKYTRTIVTYEYEVIDSFKKTGRWKYKVEMHGKNPLTFDLEDARVNEIKAKFAEQTFKSQWDPSAIKPNTQPEIKITAEARITNARVGQLERNVSGGNVMERPFANNITMHIPSHSGKELITPRLKVILAELVPYLKANPKVLQVMKDQTGFKQERIFNDLSGKGSFTIYIAVTDLGGQTFDKTWYGGEEKPSTKKGIQIDYSLLQQFEYDEKMDPDLLRVAGNDYTAAQVKSLETDINLSKKYTAVMNLLYANLVLHEYVHYGDRQQNNDKITAETKDVVQGKQNSASTEGHRGADLDIAMFGFVTQNEPNLIITNGTGRIGGASIVAPSSITKAFFTLHFGAPSADTKNILPMDAKKF